MKSPSRRSQCPPCGTSVFLAVAIAFTSCAATMILAPAAQALSACSAADIIAQDGANCPSGSGPCVIKKDFDIGNGCVLNFGARDVTVFAGSILDVGARTATFQARNFTVGPGGYIDARGNAAAPNNRGGTVNITATEAVSVQKQSSSVGRIDAGGDVGGGTIVITAGGAVTVAGRLNVDGFTSAAAGGQVSITAGGDVISEPGSTLTGTGGTGQLGAVFTLGSQGKVELRDSVVLNGGDGGTFNISAATAIILHDVDANGTGTGDTTVPGRGGHLTLNAGTEIQFLGIVSANGSSDGDGGQIDATAAFGSISVTQNMNAKTTLPYEGGVGGQISLTATGTVSVSSPKSVSVRADGRTSSGGEVEIKSRAGVTLNGNIDASAGADGGEITIRSPGNVSIAGTVDARGTGYGGVGGGVDLEAGENGSGTMTISGTVDVGGGPCNSADGCGIGGASTLEACSITITGSAMVDARAPLGGGSHTIVVHHALASAGTVTALRTGSTGIEGTIKIRHPSSQVPTLTGTHTPNPQPSSLAQCTAANTPSNCLTACPTCGDGTTQYPESCDNGNSVDCDGCSRFCRIESCDDQNACTSDSCDQALGCRHVAIVGCNP